jgi:ABC-type lipoprotein release transport system permease subunit
MSYARVFLRGWSRREWLTVLVVAITTAFLLGTALLLASAGAYTETLEDDLSGTATVAEYDSLADARAAAGEGDVVVPLATATVDGREVTVAGLPADTPAVLSGASVAWRQARFPDVGEAAAGPVSETRTVRFVGREGRVELSVRPYAEAVSGADSRTILPPWWYAAPSSTVAELGAESVLVFDSEGGIAGAVPTGRPAPPGTPLIAALPFLLAGVRELLTVLSVAALGGGVLVLVVVYSVTRMSIRDRHDDIRVVRSTGGSPRRLFAVLCARAGGLVVTGVALGYALGVVLTNAVTNLAVVAGLPVNLTGTVTPAVARLLLTLSGVLVLSGLVAGALAAWPTVRTPPAQLRLRTRRAKPKRGGPLAAVRSGRTDGGRPAGLVNRIRRAFTPTVLDPRAAIPTTATLTVFVFVVLLVGSLWGAFVPLAGTQSGTIVEAGAAHPLNSRVDAGTAELLRSQDINASAEVIYAAVRDGQPYMVRGADYDAFASVSDSRIVRGREPRSLDEAVIGRQLASTLDVEVGETIVLGGSVTPGVRRVTVVGVFDAAGDTTLNDMLVIPLEAAQGLATGPNDAHIIRTEDLSDAQRALVEPAGDGSGSGVVVTGVDAPASVPLGEPFTVNVSVRNLDDAAASSQVVVEGAGNETLARQSVTLAPEEEREVQLPVTLSNAGSTTLGVGAYTTSVRVFDPTALSIPAELPTRAPPGATLIVPVEAPNGSFVPGVEVTVGSESYTTNAQGVAVVSLPREPGTYTITAQREGFARTSREVRIEEGATRQLSVRLSVTPTVGNALTKPTVDLRVGNPWGTRLNRTLALVSPEGRTTRTVELAAGEVARVDIPTTDAGLDERFPPGEYEIRVDSVDAGEGGETVTLASTTYRVRGDSRVLSVVASGASYSPGTPVGQAIENVFGNVQVLFGAIVLLAGFATVGGTTAAFAQAVHARGRTIGIHRATGATDRQVLRTLVRDAVVIALPSTLVGVVLAYLALRLLEFSGFLVVFGIRLSIPAVPWVIAMVVGGGLVLSMTSVVVGALGYLRAPPTRLLRLRE